MEKPIPLNATRLTHLLNTTLSDWQKTTTPLESDSGTVRTELTRKFTFDSFQAAIDFMAQTAPDCDAARHHPRWENIWNTLTIHLSTWDGALHQITERDIELAKYFDQAYAAGD